MTRCEEIEALQARLDGRLRKADLVGKRLDATLLTHLEAVLLDELNKALNEGFELAAHLEARPHVDAVDPRKLSIAVQPRDAWGRQFFLAASRETEASQ